MAARPSTVEPVFDEWLQHATDQQLACRDARHMWVPRTVDFHARDRVYEVVERCARECGTTKTRLIGSEDGQVVGTPYYQYAEGFLARGAGTFGAENRGWARRERFARLAGKVGGTE